MELVLYLVQQLKLQLKRNPHHPGFLLSVLGLFPRAQPRFRLYFRIHWVGRHDDGVGVNPAVTLTERINQSYHNVILSGIDYLGFGFPFTESKLGSYKIQWILFSNWRCFKGKQYLNQWRIYIVKFRTPRPNFLKFLIVFKTIFPRIGSNSFRVVALFGKSWIHPRECIFLFSTLFDLINSMTWVSLKGTHVWSAVWLVTQLKSPTLRQIRFEPKTEWLP